MPEQIIWIATPLKDAIKGVTKDHQYEWKLRSFTANNQQKWNGQPVNTGVRIEVLHPKHGWQNCTIRDDYDFARGEPPAGKGYHVNVELPGAKIAYCWKGNGGRRYVENLWDNNSERVSVDGEKEAAQWYMNGRNSSA